METNKELQTEGDSKLVTKFELDSSEEYYWEKFQDYNKVKYIFLFFIGFFTGLIFLSIIYLVM